MGPECVQSCCTQLCIQRRKLFSSWPFTILLSTGCKRIFSLSPHSKGGSFVAEHNTLFCACQNLGHLVAIFAPSLPPGQLLHSDEPSDEDGRYLTVESGEQLHPLPKVNKFGPGEAVTAICPFCRPHHWLLHSASPSSLSSCMLFTPWIRVE